MKDLFLGFNKSVQESTKPFYEEIEYKLGYIANVIKTLEYMASKEDQDIQFTFQYAVEMLHDIEAELCEKDKKKPQKGAK